MHKKNILLNMEIDIAWTESFGELEIIFKVVKTC
jgi:hypothetical protein